MILSQQTIYINGSEHAHIVCKNCGNTQLLKSNAIKKFGIPIRVRCSCKHVFEVIFDIRKYYRKNIDIIGICYKNPSIPVQNDIRIFNISQTGVGFILGPGGIQKNEIKIEDALHLKFVLDDGRRATISVTAIVKCINNEKIGAEFWRPDASTQKFIGFYLR